MNAITFLTMVFDKIRMGIGMLLPIFADAADFRNWNRWVRLGIHLLLLGLVLWGLYYVQGKWGWLNRNLLAQAPQAIRDYYLCLLFLLLYALCWAGYALVRMFASEDEVSEFPDIEKAWRTATGELEKAGFRMNDAEAAPPLFLVLGKPAGGMDALFKACGWNFQVRTPAEADARVVVYACYDPFGVFVTVPEATGWSAVCATLLGETKYAPATGSPEAADASKTLSFGNDGEGMEQLGLSAGEGYELKTLLRMRTHGELDEAQRDRLELLAAKGNRGGAAGAAAGPFTVRADALRTGERELRFLCKLVGKARWPLCPVNGVLVLVPWAAGESETIAQVVARELAANLSVARDAFRLHYPTVAAICDVEAARGFGQFRAAFKADQLKQRIGQRIPLVPVRTDATPETATLIRRGIQWIAHAIMPVWILSALRLDVKTAGGTDEQNPNRELYRLLREVHRRVPGFASILSRVPVGKGGDDAEELDELPLLGGCYLAGTGNRPFRQAFVTGIFQRLIDDQAAVSWTRGAYAEDQRFRRMTTVGYAAIGVLVAGVAALAFVK